MKKRKIKIAPSILSADFSRLGEQVREAEEGGADYIHIDVMDGHFVPNITVGPLVVSAVKKCTKLPLDVHLMIENPEFYVEDFIEAGSDLLSVHLEACTHFHRVIKRIKSYGNVKVGVAINPVTTMTNLVNVLSDVDFVVVMSVDPGFGGQEFIPQILEKLRLLRNTIEDKGLDIEIQVDGGIHAENAHKVVAAGADVLVAGSAVFSKEKSVAEAIEGLRRAAEFGFADE